LRRALDGIDEALGAIESLRWGEIGPAGLRERAGGREIGGIDAARRLLRERLARQRSKRTDHGGRREHGPALQSASAAARPSSRAHAASLMFIGFGEVLLVHDTVSTKQPERFRALR
jgi:hypothetical protein